MLPCTKENLIVKQKNIKNQLLRKLFLCVCFQHLTIQQHFNILPDTYLSTGLQMSIQKIVYAKNLKKNITYLPSENSSFYFKLLGVLLFSNITLFGTIFVQNENYKFTNFLNNQYVIPNEETILIKNNHIQEKTTSQIVSLSQNFDPKIETKERLASYISKNYQIASQSAKHIVESAFIVSEKHKTDPILMLAIIAQESRFNPIAESSAGAIGLTQTMPSAHPEKIQALQQRSGNILNVADNIELGAKIFAEYLQRFKGNTTLALQQYNGNLADANKLYSKKVYAHFERFNKIATTDQNKPKSP